MQPPTFAQSERRSFVAPVLIALAVLAAVLVILHRTTTTSVTATLLHSEILPNSVVFKTDSMVLGPAEKTYALFVVTNLRIDNHRTQPLSLDDIVLTLTDTNGGQLTAQALRPQELANSELSFPRLKPLVTAPLLLRETPIAPGHTGEGTAVFSLSIPQSVWDARQSATIALTPYHLDAITLTIPK